MFKSLIVPGFGLSTFANFAAIELDNYRVGRATSLRYLGKVIKTLKARHAHAIATPADASFQIVMGRFCEKYWKRSKPTTETEALAWLGEFVETLDSLRAGLDHRKASKSSMAAARDWMIGLSRLA